MADAGIHYERVPAGEVPEADLGASVAAFAAERLGVPVPGIVWLKRISAMSASLNALENRLRLLGELEPRCLTESVPAPVWGFVRERWAREHPPTIAVRAGLGVFDLVETICHEVVHLLQMRQWPDVREPREPWAERLGAALAREWDRHIEEDAEGFRLYREHARRGGGKESARC